MERLRAVKRAKYKKYMMSLRNDEKGEVSKRLFSEYLVSESKTRRVIRRNKRKVRVRWVKEMERGNKARMWRCLKGKEYTIQGIGVDGEEEIRSKTKKHFEELGEEKLEEAETYDAEWKKEVEAERREPKREEMEGELDKR